MYVLVNYTELTTILEMLLIFNVPNKTESGHFEICLCTIVNDCVVSAELSKKAVKEVSMFTSVKLFAPIPVFEQLVSGCIIYFVLFQSVNELFVK